MNQKESYNGMKKVFKTIVSVISWSVLVILLLLATFLAYYFIANKLYASKGEKYEPAIGLYTIVSPSMTPNLKVYDVIVDIKVKKPEDIKVGDIITFISTSSISKGLTITHRVVAIIETENGLEYKTQGDNNLSPDSTTVQFKNILGKVLFKVPQLGRLQSFLSSSYGWLIIVVIPALLIILSDILKIFRLTGAKKKVNEALTTEVKKDEREQEKKKEIEEKLKQRYYSSRSEKEPDPLKTQQELTNVNSKTKKVELQKEIEEEKTVDLVEKESDEDSKELPKLK